MFMRYYFKVLGVFLISMLFLNASEGENKTMKSPGAKIQPLKMKPLALGEIHPTGWLLGQLRIQADGLSGHLDEFWPDIKDSGWFGGEAEGWERAPYWLDGVVPLAYLLQDKVLIKKVEKYMDDIIGLQDDSGWIGPPGDQAQYDLWAVFLVLKPLVQYFDATGDSRIPGVVQGALHWVDNHIGRRPLFNWAKFRWFEALIPIFWLYEQTADDWLLDLAVKLQAQGFDYEDFFRRWPLTEPTPKGKWNYMGHVVNNAMAVKAPALWWRLTGAEENRSMAARMIAELDHYHGMATGVFSGDECLTGKDPSHGTELCAVVEYLYSLEVLMSVLGDPAFGDRLEKIVFNALPATFSPDMWAHQYDQQANQVECSILEDRIWTTNGPESNIYGLEPNYGCCTANFSQGWPKFAVHLWQKTKDEGLAAVAYSPCEVKTKLAGVPVSLQVNTEYPFRDRIELKVAVDKPLTFPLYLRIPSWAKDAKIEMAGSSPQHPKAGEYYKLEREWSGEQVLLLTLPMQARASRRFNQALTIERGPLVYGLKMDEKWRQVNMDKPYRELPHADWEVYPTTPWNYALILNEADVTALEFEEGPIGKMPFSPAGAPVKVKVPGIRIDTWQLVKGSPGLLPVSPVSLSGKKESLILIPYGCTNLRITEFPTTK